MKFHKAVVLGAMALALVACGDDDDKKDKDDKNKETVVKYDGAVPAELGDKVKQANTVDKVDLLAAVKANDVAKVKFGDKEAGLIGGKWATAVVGEEANKIQGLATTGEEIGKLQVKKANYKGVAIAPSATEKGALTYSIDFATKKGKGEITGLSVIGENKNVKKIVLGEAAFDGAKGAGKATLELAREGEKASVDTSAGPTKNAEPKAPELSYDVNVFGPQANEIAGQVMQEKKTGAVFHGVRQDDKVTAPAK